MRNSTSLKRALIRVLYKWYLCRNLHLKKSHTMPITLERYTRLLSFARELLDKSAILAAHANRVRHKANQATSQDEVYNLILELGAGVESIRLHDPEMMKKFLEEEQHFRYTASRSSKAAVYMRRYRERQKAKQTEFANETFLYQNLIKPQDLGDVPFEDRTAQLPMLEKPLRSIKEPDRNNEIEVAQPISKTRNPMLDQITLDFIYARMKTIQDQSGEGPTSSDIANLYRKGGAPDEEVAERTAFWIGELQAKGLIEPTQIPYQYKILPR